MISKLIDRIVEKKAPVVVGLDPNLKFVPKHLIRSATDEKGETLEAAADAILEFNKSIIDATYDIIPAVKPQIAMYEQFGIPGLITYVKTVEYAHEKGLVVIGDVKRGDIGSTSEAYAIAHLGEIKIGETIHKPFDEDFATVNPYLGSDGVKPFVDVCNRCDKGIFVLVKTSNPSSGEFQDQIISGGAASEDTEDLDRLEGAEGTAATGRSLFELVADKVREWGSESMDGSYSNVGAVVGATYPGQGEIARRLMPHTYILVPGYGAQGGKASDLKPFFNKDGLGAIVNSSRGIIAAYKKEEYSSRFDEHHFADASREAAADMIIDITRAVGLD